MKEYSVLYEVKTLSEALVKANTSQEAKEKVKEVIGDPVKIIQVYEMKVKSNV